jgi:flagellar P-ring protein precursor FlgI
MKSRIIILVLMLLSLVQTGLSQRIKDIVDIQGIRGNPLTGIGLVTGLMDSGDSSLPSQLMLANILKDAGLVLSATDFSGGNVALVMVTAELGPFKRVGSSINVIVSSIGDAESLQGGILLPTPLRGLDGKGLDGQVYAVASGPISIAGWSVSGDTASMSKNHQTVARIPGGATVEIEELASFVRHVSGERFISLNLRNNDFSTARQIDQAINAIYPDSATALDSGTVEVKVPKTVPQKAMAMFIDKITLPQVKVDVAAVVVINERTGTIVVGETVGILSCAISQGSLTVKIREREEVSQPGANFSDAGSTEVTKVTDLFVNEAEGVLIPVPTVVTVSDLAATLNAIGATPSDLIAIFHALKESGALQADLKIM